MKFVCMPVHCSGGCGQAIAIPFGIDQGAVTTLLASKEWLLSVISAGERSPTVTGAHDNLLMAPTCPGCAERVHPKHVLEEARKKLGIVEGRAPLRRQPRLSIHEAAGPCPVCGQPQGSASCSVSHP